MPFTIDEMTTFIQLGSKNALKNVAKKAEVSKKLVFSDLNVVFISESILFLSSKSAREMSLKCTTFFFFVVAFALKKLDLFECGRALVFVEELNEYTSVESVSMDGL